MGRSKLWEDLQGFPVELDCLLDIALLPLDIGQVVEGVCVGGAQPQSCVVALLRFRHIALLLEGVGKVTVSIWEVWLQLDGPPICVDGQVDQALLIVDARQVAMDHCVVGAEAEGTQVARYRSVKDTGLFQNIAKVDVGIKEIRIQSHRLFKVVYGQPDFPLSIEHAAQVAPCNGKVGLGLDGLQVTGLAGINNEKIEVWKREGEEREIGRRRREAGNGRKKGGKGAERQGGGEKTEGVWREVGSQRVSESDGSKEFETG